MTGCVALKNIFKKVMSATSGPLVTSSEQHILLGLSKTLRRFENDPKTTEVNYVGRRYINATCHASKG